MTVWGCRRRCGSRLLRVVVGGGGGATQRSAAQQQPVACACAATRQLFVRACARAHAMQQQQATTCSVVGDDGGGVRDRQTDKLSVDGNNNSSSSTKQSSFSPSLAGNSFSCVDRLPCASNLGYCNCSSSASIQWNARNKQTDQPSSVHLAQLAHCRFGARTVDTHALESNDCL